MKQKYGFEEYDDPDSLMSEKLNRVTALCKGKTLLDVGCGNGALIDKVKDKFNYVVGLEPDQELLNECLHRFEDIGHIDILPLSIEDINMVDEKFDTITTLDVIEHVNDPLEALKHIRDCINPDGIFIMTAPREFDWVWRMLNKNPQHKTIHGLKGWCKLVERAGFKVISSDYVDRRYCIGMCCLIVATPA